MAGPIRILAVALLALALVGAAAAWTVAKLSGFGPREWIFGAARSDGPTVTRIELELDLRRAPQLRAVATLFGTDAGASTHDLDFLLNRDLRVDRVVENGVDRAWHAGARLRSAYHKEARVMRVERSDTRGDWSLRIEYSGRGLNGSEGRDWRGVLLLAPDELRMSVQTVFYPQTGADLDGPAVAPLLASVRVLAPDGFEVYVPGRSLGSEPADGGGTSWRFVSEHPTVLSLFAAPRARRETALGDARVVTLLREEHAHLSDALALESAQILRAYAELWGPIGARTLGVCEIEGRGSSYNWAAQGIITIDKDAFDTKVPVAQLSHEIAHLWWGQEVVASGRGERFLTESLAEYASWRYLASAHGEASAQSAIDGARESWLREAHTRGADPALADVTFSTPGYEAMAYAKGPLVLLALERRIGTRAIDALLRDHRAAAAVGATIEGFSTALRKHAGDAASVAPWIERAGHAHVELGALTIEGESIRGSVLVGKCPAACPPLTPTRVEIRARWPDRREEIELTLGGSSTPFEARWPAPQLVELDPRGLVLGACGDAYYRGPAQLVASEPADSSADVALGPLSVRLRFASALGALPEDAAARIQRATTAANITAESVVCSVRTARLEEDGRALCIAIDGTLPARPHVVAIPGGFLDAGGLPMPAQRLAFTTRAGDPASRPRIVSTEPPNGAIDVACDLEHIRVVFSEPMRSMSGFKTPRVAKLENAGWSYPPIHFGDWEDERTISWKIKEPLEPGRGYGLPFDERYLDREGHEVIGFELKFTTASR